MGFRSLLEACAKIRLVQNVLIHFFEQLVIVALIYSNPNQNGVRNLKYFFEGWSD